MLSTVELTNIESLTNYSFSANKQSLLVKAFN